MVDVLPDTRPSPETIVDLPVISEGPPDLFETLHERITFRRAEVLRELAEGYAEREIALRLGIEVSGVRSHIEQLRLLTGCQSGRELGRWWRANRNAWLDCARVRAGIA